MITLNLHDMKKSDILFKLNRFPDGEVQVTDLEIDKLVEGMRVIAPIKNAEQLFVFIQLMYLIHERIRQVSIVIPYLMGARNDRKMQAGRSVNLFHTLDLIGNTMFPLDTLTFITVHNEDAVKIWFDVDVNSSTPLVRQRKIRFVTPYPEFMTNEEEVVIFPDKGALKRFGHLVNGPYLVAEKTRDINQSESKILTYELLNPLNIDLTKIKKVNVIDDLVDGGRTFKLLSSEIDIILKSDYDVTSTFGMNLYLTHFVQFTGLIELTEYYDNIYVCDTFSPLPINSNIHKLKEIEDMF